MAYVKDTIAARATAPGRGGIGIVRVSGPAVSDIAVQLLGKLPEPRYATYSPFSGDDGSTIDAGIALYFKAPDSFTGEDVLEFHVHGGPAVLAALKLCFKRSGVLFLERDSSLKSAGNLPAACASAIKPG